MVKYNKEQLLAHLDKGTQLFFTMRNAVLLYVIYLLWRVVSMYIKNQSINGYSWTELLINYEGGFIRRGLLGQLLYESAPFVNPQVFGTLLFLSALGLLVWISWRWISAAFDSVTCYLVFLSPAYFLFYFNDKDMFVRKDVFILVLTMGMFFIARKALGKRESTVYLLTVLFIACHTLSFLIQEMAIFFFPLPFLLLGIAYEKIKKLHIWFGIGLCVELASLYIAARYVGTALQGQAILASWQTLLPDFRGQGAMDYIGKPFSTWFAEVCRLFSNTTIVSTFILTLIIGFIPLFFICRNYKSHQVFTSLSSSRVLRWLAAPALLPPFLLMTFAQDLGRFIAAGLLNILFFLIMLQQSSPRPVPDWIGAFCKRVQNSWKLRLGVLVFTLFYCVWWSMPHCTSDSVIKISGSLKRLFSFF